MVKVNRRAARGGGILSPSLFKRKAILIHDADFAEVQKRLEQIFFPSAALVILYEGGKACGEASAKRLIGQFGSSTEDMLQAIAKIKEAEGWGKITFKDSNFEKNHMRVIVQNSFEARGYGKSATPVCHLLRGYLAGVLSTMLTPNARTRKVELVEIKCVAKGDEYCEFQTPKGSKSGGKG
jgi:predicted hydrocarbon binding protein